MAGVVAWVAVLGRRSGGALGALWGRGWRRGGGAGAVLGAAVQGTVLVGNVPVLTDPRDIVWPCQNILDMTWIC